MKILHTADWHIGKHLYKKELYDELRLFFDFLIETVIAENVDVVLISGDIFDTVTPSNEDRALYYNVLSSLVKANTRVIITAGNHDSISQLEASGELLKMLNIDVVGGISDNLSSMIIELKKDNQIEALVMAVPYIRDSDFRKYAQDSVFNKQNEMRHKVVAYYRELKEYVKEKYDNNIPMIAMGHLFVMGGTVSDSERDIEVGTLGGISAGDIDDIADYFALGHLHREQSFSNGKIRYSGSPVALSFSERNDEKCMYLLNLSAGKINCAEVKIPVFRQLFKLSGTYQEVVNSLVGLPPPACLKHLVELDISEENEDPGIIQQLQELIKTENGVNYEILQFKISFKSTKYNDVLQDIHLSLDEMSPSDIFKELLSSRSLEDTVKEGLQQSFSELLDLYYEQR